MSVMIRGAKMPKNCEKCRRYYWSNFNQAYYCDMRSEPRPLIFDGRTTQVFAPLSSCRADNCPLVPVPTPHGRLIDADEAAKAFDSKEERYTDYANHDILYTHTKEDGIFYQGLAYGMYFAARVMREQDKPFENCNAPTVVESED